LNDESIKKVLDLGEQLRVKHNIIADKWCPECGAIPEECQFSTCINSEQSRAFVNGEIAEDEIELTYCSSAFLLRVKTEGDKIELSTLKIAMSVRDYIDLNSDIEAQRVYYEVATYALRGRTPRTVRYWVEAIRGYTNQALSYWHNIGLTMSHFETARRLYRDDLVDDPAQALDACINEREHSNRPLTVNQMEALYNPAKPANEQIADFEDWMRDVVLKRKAPFGWSDKKIKRFEIWKEEGKEFLK